MKLTVDPAKADTLFLYYLFSSDEHQQYIQRNVVQTGVPHTNLAHLRTTPLHLPPLREQRAIAAIVGALDDKIELNFRMNRTLEAMAEAQFQSWFVDFDPVRAKMAGRPPAGMDAETARLFPDLLESIESGDIPIGWVVRPLDSVATFLNGLALQKYPPVDHDYLPVIKIAELRTGVTGGSDRASPYLDDRYVVVDGDILFSWSGSLEVVIWCGGRGALNQHLFKVTSSEYPRWFCCLWIKHYLPEFRVIAAGKATTMGHIQRHHLTGALTLVPPPVLLARMATLMEPFLQLMVSNNVMSRSLAVLRDALLPPLLSGELRLPEAEKLVEATV